MTPLDDANILTQEQSLATKVQAKPFEECDRDTLDFKEILEELESCDDVLFGLSKNKNKKDAPSSYAPLMNLFDLSSKMQSLQEGKEIKSKEAISDISFIVQKIVEEVKTVICVMHQEGVYETSCTLMKPDSIFDGLEISVYTFKNAPNEFNVEIKSCTSTLALLQKNLHTMSKQIEALSLPFVFKRVDLSVKKSDQKNVTAKSYIKPVTEAKNNFHDQQT